MRPTRVVRTGLVLAVASGIALTGFSTSAALAATVPANLTVHVGDGETGLENIEVYAISDTRFVDLGETDANGDLTGAEVGPGGGSKLKAGTYQVAFFDADDDRYLSSSTYVDQSRDDVVIKAGANTLPDVTMIPGGSVSATVTTPSGKPLDGIGFRLVPADEPNTTGAEYGDGTGPDGTFTDQALAVGTYRIDYQLGNGAKYVAAPETFRIENPGQHVDATFTARPKADTLSLVGSSAAKGSATMVLKIANARYGITDPGGLVTIRNSKGAVVAGPTQVASVNGKGKVSFTFPASSGKHTYTAFYGDGDGPKGDLADTSVTTTFTVK